MTNEGLELGPVDVFVLGWPADSPPKGEAIPAFMDLVDRQIIRVLDVLAVYKDENGNVSGFEIKDLDREGFSDLTVFEGARSGMLGDEDVSIAGEGLQPGETAVLICIENSWAAPLVTAVRRGGGRMIAAHRVPAQDVMDAVEALDSEKAMP